MNFSDYQKQSRSTAVYKNAGNNFVYPTLGLAGETGEVVEKIKKLMRNDDIEDAAHISATQKADIEKEMGDVLWYLAQLATELNLELETIASKNLQKLKSRKDRDMLHSEGDDR